MKKSNRIAISAIAVAVSVGLFAVSASQAAEETGAGVVQAMPVMGTMQLAQNDDSGNPYYWNMPMMGGSGGQMPMMAYPQGQQGQQGQAQVAPGQQGQMPMYPYGYMMHPQMMQYMMGANQQHMQVMEQRLANIEALLRQLVELQKKRK